MPALRFELTTTPGTIQGNVQYYEMPGGGDYTEVVTNPNPDQIHDDQPWKVELQSLKQTGAVFGAFGGNKWRFRVYFEQIGFGELAPGFKEILFPVNPANPFTYPTQVINFAPGEIPVGMYKLYAELKMIDANGLSPIAGAGELTPAGVNGKVLQIINA